ncbi:restriction endonuclease subunit S [Bacillus sp. 522_BSPC]|uniref:restriction endonuclease subunit S n=1 Tax=Bacillus sp. 522_BSPC TaxID=1579338 RepID=UPI00080B2DD8|nr:restriction endonuclease subunit S [Bacillus sp. 522_BSPC]
MNLRKLSDVCEIIMGQSPDSSSYNESGEGLPFFQGKADFGELYPIPRMYCNKPLKIAITNDILMSVRAPVGDVNIATEECCIGRGVAAIRSKENIDFKYLYYVLEFMKERIASLGTGSTFKAISKIPLSSIEIPVPTLEQQIKIVNVLDKVKDAINKRHYQLATLDELTQSLFLEMFGNPVANSKGWDIASCKDITEKIGSGSTPRGGNASYKESGISLIRSLNVHNNNFTLKDLAFIDDRQAEKLKNVEVQENDILLNITGASVARSCIVPNNILPARVNQHVSIIRVKENFVSHIFLSNLFTNEIYQRYLWQIATSGGATREAITKQQIENLSIILPPLNLQNEFAYKIEQIEKQRTLMQSSKVKLENMYNSLLQKAFKGELF